MDLSIPLAEPVDLSPRPDAATCAAIDVGVKLITSHGKDAAHQYLLDQGVDAATIARVLGPDGQRRKPQLYGNK